MQDFVKKRRLRSHGENEQSETSSKVVTVNLRVRGGKTVQFPLRLAN